MKHFRQLIVAAVVCGGVLILSGCHSEAAEAGGVPIPPPHAAPPVQAQIQEIENNSHIPAAQKAALEAKLSQGSGIAANK